MDTVLKKTTNLLKRRKAYQTKHYTAYQKEETNEK